MARAFVRVARIEEHGVSDAHGLDEAIAGAVEAILSEACAVGRADGMNRTPSSRLGGLEDEGDLQTLYLREDEPARMHSETGHGLVTREGRELPLSDEAWPARPVFYGPATTPAG